MSEAESALLQGILQIVISVILPVLAGLAVWYVKLLIQRVKARMSREQLAFADSLITMFVGAAEQYDLAGLAARTGAEKKAWVVAQAQAALDRSNIQMDASLLADLVESAILSGAKNPPYTPGADPED